MNTASASRADAQPMVAPLFEQPGILSPRGRWTLEPSLQYGYSSSNRVALVGYTVIPALLIGLGNFLFIPHNPTAAVTGAVTVVVGMTPLHTSVWWTEATGPQMTGMVLKGLKPLLPQDFGKYLPE